MTIHSARQTKDGIKVAIIIIDVLGDSGWGISQVYLSVKWGPDMQPKQFELFGPKHPLQSESHSLHVKFL